MRPAIAAWLILATAAASAWGDRVVLKDGRTFEGAVTESEGRVVIEHAFGTISFPASEVAGIRRGPTPGEQLESQLAVIDRSDPEALYQLALWARDNDLTRQAGDLLREVLQLDGDHAGARKLLGQVRVDGKWTDSSAALDLARGRLDAGRNDEALESLLADLSEVVKDSKQRQMVGDIQAHCLLRSRQFAKAQKCFETLASRCPAPDSVRYAAVATILSEHPDGMYVLGEPYPPVAMLLGPSAPAVEPGPASLARPAVLEAALRDQAKDAIRAGRGAMEEARKLELTDPEAAKVKYAAAGKSFDTADAIVPDIARSYRVEAVRRRIAMLTRSMNVEAAKFDALKEELGKRDLTPGAYRDLITRMLRSLACVRSDLTTILQSAGAFERELVLEVTDATHRIQRVDALRDVLTRELHGK